MRGGATAPPLLPLIALLGVAGGGADAQVTSHESYAGQVLLRTVHANLGNVMEQPFGVIRFSQASVDPLDFLDTGSTEALRTWMYQQTVAVGLGDRERTSMDMIYYGGEDGRFVGYFSHTSYTERGRGYGMAADLPWAPYELGSSAATLGNINTVCTGSPPCRGESGKTLATSLTCTGTSTAPGTPACDLDPSTDGSVSCLAGCAPGGCPGSWSDRPGACTDRLHQAVDAATEAACLAGPGDNTWFAPCAGDCCDNNIRNCKSLSSAEFFCASADPTSVTVRLQVLDRAARRPGRLHALAQVRPAPPGLVQAAGVYSNGRPGACDLCRPLTVDRCCEQRRDYLERNVRLPV